MISRKKKWRGDRGLLELRARAVYIINEKKDGEKSKMERFKFSN